MRRRNPPPTDAELADLRARLRAGEPLRAAAEASGVPRRRAYRLVSDEGLSRGKGRRPKLSPDKIARIRELRAGGMSARVAAEMFGVSAVCVKKLTRIDRRFDVALNAEAERAMASGAFSPQFVRSWRDICNRVALRLARMGKDSAYLLEWTCVSPAFAESVVKWHQEGKLNV